MGRNGPNRTLRRRESAGDRRDSDPRSTGQDAVECPNKNDSVRRNPRRTTIPRIRRRASHRVSRLLRAALERKRMSRSRTRRARSPRRVAAAVATAGTIALGTALSAFGADVATASSHREAPLISADPAVDNTDVYAFVSPDDPELGDLRGQLVRPAGAQRRPHLLPVGHRRQLRHQHRHRRERQVRHRLPADLPHRGPARQRHVPLQQRAGHQPGRREPAVPPVLHAVGLQGRRLGEGGRGPGRAVAAGSGPPSRTTAPCATRRSRTCPAAARSTSARPRTRSSPTCGCSTCCTAATCPRSGRTRSPRPTSTPGRCSCR